MGAGIEAPPVSGVSSDPAFQGPFLVLNLHHSSSEAPRMPINGSDPAACFMGRGARYLRADPTRGVNLEPEQNEESNMNLTDELFQRYSDLVYQECGINLHEGKKALLQAGIAIPVFAMTPRAKELIIEKIRRSNEQVLIKPTHLPVKGDSEPSPLI